MAGRVIFVRNGGKLTLRNGAGPGLQAMLSLDKVGAEALDEWKHLDDLVSVTGEVITSRRANCPCSPIPGR